MSERVVNFEVNIENLNEFNEALRQFPNELKESFYSRFQRVSNREEKILKSTTGFRDRTGRLRRELFVVAKYNPLSIEAGTYTPYASYVAHGHGQWKGNWWMSYLRGLANRLPNDLKRIAKEAIVNFNEKYKM